MANLRIGGVTDPGLRRERNEDAVAWDETFGFAILADGVGGHSAGEIASRVVVDVMDRCLRAVGFDALDLAAAVAEANRRVYAESLANPLYAGMGSTVVAALFHAQALTVAHVGDSRLYRYRDGRLAQMTRDHSLVQELVNEGVLTPEEARESPYANIITRALGSGPDVQVETAEYALLPGDCVLLCSDGLSDLVRDDEIAEILARDAEPQAAAQDLTALANAHGGNDNISVIVVDIA